MQALHGSDSKYLSRRRVLSQLLVKHADLQDSTNRKTFNKVYNFATKKKKTVRGLIYSTLFSSRIPQYFPPPPILPEYVAPSYIIKLGILKGLSICIFVPHYLMFRRIVSKCNAILQFFQSCSSIEEY